MIPCFKRRVFRTLHVVFYPIMRKKEEKFSSFLLYIGDTEDFSFIPVCFAVYFGRRRKKRRFLFIRIFLYVNPDLHFPF